jgi:hypothetical protein
MAAVAAEAITAAAVVAAEDRTIAVAVVRTAAVIPTDINSQGNFKARSNSWSGPFYFSARLI